MAYNYANIGPIFFPVAGYGVSALGTGSQIGATRSNIGGGTHRHKGHDIFAPEGTPLVAPVSGRIENVGLSTSPGSKLGYRVTIVDARGNRHILAHMMNDSSVSLGLRQGQQVSAGQQIGFIGRTEQGGKRTTVPHVHYSINEGRSNLVDPYEFLKGTRVQVADPNTLGRGSNIGAQIVAGAAASRSYNTSTGVAQAAYQAGFRGPALNTAIAIAQGESGFRPDARGDISLQNSTWGPSIGLWQIRSLKSETGKGTSRDATRLTDPLFNARAAFEISKGGTDFSPWSVYNSGKYRDFMAEAEQTVSGAGGEIALNSDITGPESQLYVDTEIAQFAGFMGVPGVSDIIARFARGEINIVQAKNFIGALPWWKENSEHKRTLVALKQTDPASYDDRVRTKAEELIGVYSDAGITPPFESLVDVFLSGTVNRDSELYKLAERYLLGNFSTDAITQVLLNETPPNEIGDIAGAMEDLGGIASDYFIKYSPEELQNFAMRILRGEYTTDKFLLDTKNISKKNFAYDQDVLDAIERGVRPKQIFDTHISNIANTLEMDADTVDFTNPDFQPVLDFIDKDTNKRRSMTAGEAGRYVRTLPQFRSTKTAQSDVASFLTSFSNSMVR